MDSRLRILHKRPVRLLIKTIPASLPHLPQIPRSCLYHPQTTMKSSSCAPIGQRSYLAKWPTHRPRWHCIASSPPRRCGWTAQRYHLMSSVASPSTGRNLITPAHCTVWLAWATCGRAPPNTCWFMSTVRICLTGTFYSDFFFAHSLMLWLQHNYLITVHT